MKSLFIVAVVFGLAACNTAEGVKKDVAIGAEKTGEALQKGAKRSAVRCTRAEKLWAVRSKKR